MTGSTPGSNLSGASRFPTRWPGSSPDSVTTACFGPHPPSGGLATPVRAEDRAVRALAVAGAESSVVNAVLKAVIGRPRPDGSDLRLGDNIVPLREPTTSSFPSGHTLAAFCAATVLSEPGDLGGSALLFGCAGLIGASRIHLRAHHGSDVLGGMAIGVVLGVIGRRLV